MSEPYPLRPEVLLQHREFLRGLARGLLADDAGADDVIQEAYVRALQRPPRSEDALRSWLARVVRNLALNRLRGERRRAARERDVARSEPVPSSAEVAERIDVQRRVVAAVHGLHEPYRTVIYLRWYEGLEPLAIARRMERPIETVRSQLKRGHALLRAELDDELGGRETWAGALVPLLGLGASKRAGSSLATTSLPVLPTAAATALLLVAGIALLAVVLERGEPTPVDTSGTRLVQAGERALSGAPRTTGARMSPFAPSSVPEPLPSAAAASAAPVRGRCVAARTDEPLPGLEIEIDDGSRTPERVATDAAGFFRGERSVAAGRVRLNVRNGPGLALLRRVEHEHSAGASPLLALEVGPTYRIDLERPGDVSTEPVTAFLEDPAVPGTRVETVLRDGPVLWARFASAPRASLMESGGRSMFALRLESAGGDHVAERRVHAQGGVYPDVLRMTLERRGQVHVVVVGAGPSAGPGGGPGAGSSGEVVLELVGEHRPARRETVGASGTVVFAGLAGGEYVLRTADNRVEPLERRVALADGESVRVELDLVHRPLARLAVELASTTGTHVPRGRLLARDVDDPALEYAFDDVRTGAWSVPHGDYELFPPMDDGLPWDPPSRRVSVPGPPATFTCLDDVALRELVLRVRDARTGAAVESAHAVVLVDRYRLGIRGAAAFEPDLCARPIAPGRPSCMVPDGYPLAFVVEAEGYTSVQGDRGDLRREDGRLVADVQLAPSWKTQLWIGTRDADGLPVALAGARVRTSGGKLLGTSLGDGRVRLELLYDPGKLVVEYGAEGARWSVASWEGYLFGRRRTELDLHRVWMTPPARPGGPDGGGR